MKKVFAILSVIALIGVPLFYCYTESDKAETTLQIERIKRESAERKDSISDYYLMVRKKMAQGYTEEEAKEFTKTVMDRNDQKLFDSIYFNN